MFLLLSSVISVHTNVHNKQSTVKETLSAVYSPIFSVFSHVTIQTIFLSLFSLPSLPGSPQLSVPSFHDPTSFLCRLSSSFSTRLLLSFLSTIIYSLPPSIQQPQDSRLKASCRHKNIRKCALDKTQTAPRGRRFCMDGIFITITESNVDYKRSVSLCCW